METLILLIAIFAASYVLSRPTFSSNVSLFGLRFMFLSGTEFILIGYIIGPREAADARWFTLITGEALRNLDPMINLALGWVGFLFGVQFTMKSVAKFPVPRYFGAFLQCILTSLLVAGAGWLVLGWAFPEMTWLIRTKMALILGICGGLTSPSSIAYCSKVFRIPSESRVLLQFIASVDAIPSLIMLGLFVSFFHNASGAVEASVAGWQWLILGTLISWLLGLLLYALTEIEHSSEELLIWIIGFVALTSGLALYLHLPVVYMTFIIGLVVANTSYGQQQVYSVAAHLEKPLYITFLILTGSSLVLTDWRVFAIAAAFLITRLIGKTIFNSFWAGVREEKGATHRWVGAALFAQGGMTIVLVLNFLFVYRDSPMLVAPLKMVASGVVVGVLAGEFISPFTIRRLFPARTRPGRSSA